MYLYWNKGHENGQAVKHKIMQEVVFMQKLTTEEREKLTDKVWSTLIRLYEDQTGAEYLWTKEKTEKASK